MVVMNSRFNVLVGFSTSSGGFFVHTIVVVDQAWPQLDQHCHNFLSRYITKSSATRGSGNANLVSGEATSKTPCTCRYRVISSDQSLSFCIKHLQFVVG